MVDDKIVDFFLENGFVITPETLIYLRNENSKNRENLIKSAIYRAKSLAERPLVITKEFLLEQTDRNLQTKKSLEVSQAQQIRENKKDEVKDRHLSSKKVSKFKAKDVEPIIEIMIDPTGNLIGTGEINNVHKYFLDRFMALQNLLQKRPDSKGAITIDQVFNYTDKVKVIGMVKDKKESEDKVNKGIYNYSIELEDLHGTIRVFIPGSVENLSIIGSCIMLDQVICVEGVLKNGQIIAENIYFPDIPEKQHFSGISDPICAALISDLHFGSKKFMADNFINFIEWLQGKVGSEKQRELARRVKYVLIAGDLIDGVGVYPEHEKNLSIVDIKGQYELAAEYLSQIPEHISIIIIPGGAHDAVRKALPQEAIPRSYARPLYDLENTIMRGNPSFFKVHGMKTLMYHGEGIDDIVLSIPKMSYSTNELAMIELLKSRHLAPIYGKKVGISPEPYDWLVIRDVPDLFLCGHTHVTRTAKYKGVNLINCGTFQAETEYQQSLGIKPTPGIVPIIDISNYSIKLKKF